MNDDEKTIGKWQPILDKLCDTEEKRVWMLKYINHHTLEQQELSGTPVFYNDNLVGRTDAAGNIRLYDTPEAKTVMSHIKTGIPIGISSRKTGTINPDGSITETEE